jgi:hypothetical protein
MHVSKISEMRSQTEQFEPAAPSTSSSRKSILVLAVFALGLNAAAAAYTVSPSAFSPPNVSTLAERLPQREPSAPKPDQILAISLLPTFDIPLPNFSSEELSEPKAPPPILDGVAVTLLPTFDIPLPNFSTEELLQPKASKPIADPVLAALKDIQSVQQQQFAALQEHNSSVQQSAALRQQDSITLASLRQGITDEKVDVSRISSQIRDEHSDVKKVSAQISALLAKVDSLQSAVGLDLTASIAHGHHRLTGWLRKGTARQPKPVGPVSVGGAPLSYSATAPAPKG